jgi:hypothetical protein
MTPRYERVCRTVAILAVVLGTSRCGGAPAESPGSAAATTQSKPPAQPRNACLLVDRDDMARLAKQKVTLLHNIAASEQTNCEVYLEGKSDRAVIILEVHWSGGRDLARTGKSAANDKGVDIASLTAPGGGADDAFYSDAMGWVIKGDVMLKFTMPGLGAEDMQKNFVPLARKALARLP